MLAGLGGLLGHSEIISISLLQHEVLDERYVYITDVYIHDENLNVVARTKLSQCCLKRASDKLKFRVGIDW
jgi:hypothetical protein